VGNTDHRPRATVPWAGRTRIGSSRAHLEMDGSTLQDLPQVLANCQMVLVLELHDAWRYMMFMLIRTPYIRKHACVRTCVRMYVYRTRLFPASRGPDQHEHHS
jgi:hypothetical protein